MPINPGDPGPTVWANGVDAALAAKLDANLTAHTGVTIADQAGDVVSQYGTNETGQRWDIRVGTAATPTAGGGPSVKIAQTEKVTNLATQMGGNAVANEHNAALSVAALGLTGSLAQTNAVMIIANGAPTGTDVCALGSSGMVTGGTGTGFGAYLQGRRNVPGASAIGAEIRVQNESGADGTANPNGMSNTVGVWVTTAGTGGFKSGAGVSLGTADATQFIHGYHTTAGAISDCAFRDESGSYASFSSQGTHNIGVDLNGAYSSYALRFTPKTDAAGGISFGNDAFLYRSAAGVLTLNGALAVTGKVSSGAAKPHAEFTATVSLANATQGNIGVMTVDAANTPDTTMVTSPSAGTLTFTNPGLYAITAAVNFQAVVTGESWASINTPSGVISRSHATGTDRVSVSDPTVYIPTGGGTVTIDVFQTSGATRTVLTRVAVTRIA